MDDLSLTTMEVAAENSSSRPQELPTASSSRRLVPRQSGKHGDVLPMTADKRPENKTKSFYQKARQQFLSKKFLFAGILLIAVSSRMLIGKRSRVLDDEPEQDDESTPFEKLSNMENNAAIPCDKGTSKISRPIVLDYKAIKAHPRTSLGKLSPFTEEAAYSRRLVHAPGIEAYLLLHYLTQNYGDCRHVADIGTFYVTSALALGATGTAVRTYDLPRAAKDRQKAFRGATEEDWYTNVVGAGVQIAFHNLEIMKMPPRVFASHFNTTWLILIDTNHLPYSKPFEREFFQRLMDMNYKGLVLVDDIHGPGTFGGETERWWYELIDHTEERGYACHDLTEVGHFTGTGLVDFSGMVKVVK